MGRVIEGDGGVKEIGAGAWRGILTGILNMNGGRCFQLTQIP